MQTEKREPNTVSGDGRKLPGSQSAFEQLKSLLLPKSRRPRFEATEDHILSILIARRERDAVFGPNLFSEPSWDALLELYAARLGNRKVSLGDLSRAIDTPASTTARWVAVLEERKLVAMESDTLVSGRRWVSLTDDGASKIKQLADHWGAAFRSL